MLTNIVFVIYILYIRDLYIIMHSNYTSNCCDQKHDLNIDVKSLKSTT